MQCGLRWEENDHLGQVGPLLVTHPGYWAFRLTSVLSPRLREVRSGSRNAMDLLLIRAEYALSEGLLPEYETTRTSTIWSIVGGDSQHRLRRRPLPQPRVQLGQPDRLLLVRPPRIAGRLYLVEVHQLLDLGLALEELNAQALAHMPADMAMQ